MEAPEVYEDDVSPQMPEMVVVKMEAVKLSYRQNNAGNIVSFRLHPDEDDKSIANIKLGSLVCLVVVEIKD